MLKVIVTVDSRLVYGFQISYIGFSRPESGKFSVEQVF